MNFKLLQEYEMDLDKEDLEKGIIQSYSITKFYPMFKDLMNEYLEDANFNKNLCCIHLFIYKDLTVDCVFFYETRSREWDSDYLQVITRPYSLDAVLELLEFATVNVKKNTKVDESEHILSPFAMYEEWKEDYFINELTNIIPRRQSEAIARKYFNLTRGEMQNMSINELAEYIYRETEKMINSGEEYRD